MTVSDRQIGVITVQSMKRHAYTDRDRLIFGTLSAYAAIAINNAQTYQELQETQKKLLAQEKMAALGSLVAGVAHELNTPISNSILLASTMSHKTEILDKKLNGNQMRRSDLLHYLQDAKDASSLNLSSLQSAADLVESFKQIAVDRTTAHRRPFNVKQLAHDIMATMMNQLHNLAVTMDADIPDEIIMDSYPGPLGQVIMNLINNALRHAFADDQGGRITLSARHTSEGHIELQFTDNGCGISPDNLLKIFDPFFTTKLGQGGSGLGLSISYNIVTSILNGQISAQSTPGAGTTFTLDLPLVVPV
jgi:signal transduction histidine kinase